MVLSLVYEYSHLATDGIDHHLFAELCSFKLINNSSAHSRYQNIKNSPRKADSLPKCIASIIHRSMLGVNIAIAAMIVIERFQTALVIPGKPFTEEMDDAGRLFLIGYMVVAKVIQDEPHPSWFWRRVSKYRYSECDLNRMERHFYDVVGWKVQIDGETFNASFIGMMDSYHSYLESHKLPSVPPPVYQRIKKNETVRKHVAFMPEDRRTITILSNDDEVPFTRTIVPPRVLQSAQWQKGKWDFFRVLLRQTPFSFSR